MPMRQSTRFEGYWTGLRMYPTALHVVNEHRLWPFVAIPGIMSVSYAVVLILLGIQWFPDMAGYIYQQWIPAFLQWKITYYLSLGVLWLMMMLTAFMTYQPVILILFSPILSYLSELTEIKITSAGSSGFSWKQFLEDMYRSVLFNLRNALRMLILVLCAWLLILVPLIGPLISSAVILWIQAKYGGISLVDYTLERKRYSVAQRIAFARRYRSRVIGVGLGFMFTMLLPLVGWFIAPALGTVAATLVTLDILNDPELASISG